MLRSSGSARQSAPFLSREIFNRLSAEGSWGKLTLVLDCFSDFLVDGFHLGRRHCAVVSHAREAEEIARKFRVARMEYEGSAHAEDTAEQACFEDDIVSRGSLTGPGLRRSQRGARRPVVLRKHKCREIDFLGEFKEAFQCRCPRMEGCRPGIYVCDIFETACQRLQQLLLLS
jgi:hypothetical protein